MTAIIKILEKLSPTLSKVQTATDVSLTNAEILKAEIIWSLYCVKNCYSNKILNELDNTFSKMFSGSNIAKSFQMGCSKQMHLGNYSLAPYLRNYLIDKVKESEVFVVSFDKSLYSVMQMCKMDLMSTYFDLTENKVAKSKVLGYIISWPCMSSRST